MLISMAQNHSWGTDGDILQSLPCFGAWAGLCEQQRSLRGAKVKPKPSFLPGSHKSSQN